MHGVDAMTDHVPGPLFAAFVEMPAPLGALSPRRVAAAERLARVYARRFARRGGWTVVEFGETSLHLSDWGVDVVAVRVVCRGVA
jgi:hypothetical protein